MIIRSIDWSESRCGSREPGSALLTRLDHERLIVAVSPPASDIHRAPHRQVNQHRVHEREHGVRCGAQLCLRSRVWGSIVGRHPLTRLAATCPLHVAATCPLHERPRALDSPLVDLSDGSARYADSASATARSAICTSSSSATSSS
jgi:hypothetical protein